MMDYIYGELCKAVEKVTYEGLDSKTAAVVVDNEKNTIQVSILDVPAELLTPNVDVLGPSGRYILLATLNLNTVTYKWITIEDFLAKLELDKETIYTRIDNEAIRTDNMIKQVNDNVSLVVNQINKNMADGFNTINGGIATEIEERKQADSTLSDDIEKETTRATAAEEAITQTLNQEIEYRKQGDDTLTSNLDSEVERAKAAEEANKSAIEAEVTRATEQEGVLQHTIEDESSRAQAKENELNTAIQSEATARNEADTEIHDKIDAIDTRVENLEGKTTRLFYEGEVNPPSASDINTWVTGLDVEPKYEAPFEGIAVVVLMSDETYHIWHYYSNLSSWRDDGVDTVSTFTNDKKGIIQGSTNDGYVSAEGGLGKVSGWNTVKTDIAGLQTEKLNLSDIPNTYSGNSEQFPMTQKATNDAIQFTLAEAQAAWEKGDDIINSALEQHEGDFENPHQVTKAQVGLEFVENLAPEDLPISTATQEALDAKAPTNHSSLSTEYGVGDATHYGHVKVDAIPESASTNAVSSMGVYSALSNKVDKVEGKQLSTEDFTTAEKEKLAGIEASIVEIQQSIGAISTSLTSILGV